MPWKADACALQIDELLVFDTGDWDVMRNRVEGQCSMLLLAKPHLCAAIIRAADEERRASAERAAAVDKVVVLLHLLHLLPRVHIPGAHGPVWGGCDDPLAVRRPVQLQDRILVPCTDTPYWL